MEKLLENFKDKVRVELEKEHLFSSISLC